VGPVVVEDEVDLEVGGHLALDPLEELPELDRAMPAVRLADDLAAHDVERGEERGDPVDESCRSTFLRLLRRP